MKMPSADVVADLRRHSLNRRGGQVNARPAMRPAFFSEKDVRIALNNNSIKTQMQAIPRWDWFNFAKS
jgi:hypothetical protein